MPLLISRILFFTTTLIYCLVAHSADGLLNISTNGFVDNQHYMNAGFIVNAEKRFVVMGEPSNFLPALADPVLELREIGSNNLLAQNDNWQTHTTAAEVSLLREPDTSSSSAFAITLPSGLYYAVLKGKNESTGFGIVSVTEVGDMDGSSDLIAPLSAVIPEGAYNRQERVDFLRPPIIPAESPVDAGKAMDHLLTTAVFATWTQSLNRTALLEVDFFRVVEEDPISGEVKVIHDITYNDNSGQVICITPGGRCDGALYLRNPRWFYEDMHRQATGTAIVRDGLLTVDLSSTPDEVFHWWTEHVKVQEGKRYWSNMRVRLTGMAALKLGADYWIVDENGNFTVTARSENECDNPGDSGCVDYTNRLPQRPDGTKWCRGGVLEACEAWVSDWYGDTGGQFMNIVAPAGGPIPSVVKNALRVQ